MKTKVVIRVSAVCAAIAFAAAGAFAATTNVVVNPDMVVDGSNNGSPGTADTDSANFSVTKYSGGLVLTGVSFSAASSSAFNTFFQRGSGGTGNPSGTSTLVTTVQLAGASSVGSAVNTVASVGGSGTNSSTAYTTSAAIGTTNLSNFVGTGTYSNAGTVTQSVAVSKTDGGSRNLYADPASNTAVVTYNYQAQGHANGSIGTLGANTGSYDFGHVNSNTTATTGVSIFNGTGLFGLDIKSIACTDTNAGNGVNDCGAFSIANTFANIAGGSSLVGLLSFIATPLVTTIYNARFDFVVGDALAGIGAGKNNSIETLSYNVTAAVPEPSTYIMLLAGLGAIGFMARRRRPERDN